MSPEVTWIQTGSSGWEKTNKHKNKQEVAHPCFHLSPPQPALRADLNVCTHAGKNRYNTVNRHKTITAP